MLAYIKGTILTVDPVIVENNNLGYLINCHVLPNKIGQSIELWLHTIFKEHGQDVYGFDNLEKLKLFKKLININKVGGKLALNILNFFELPLLYKLIQQGDDKLLAKVPGVGIKMAQKIINELGMVVKHGTGLDLQVFSALENLGFDHMQIREAVNMLHSQLENLTLEKQISKILQVIK